MDRKNSWIQTYTGLRFFPWAPRPQDVVLEDIAHALSQIPRYGGHLPQPYSVAEHSMMVARHCPQDLRLVGLMHDATEAYVGDMVRPLKDGLHSYQLLEQRVWEAIALRFDLPQSIPPAVKRVDTCALATEVGQLIPAPVSYWGQTLNVELLPEIIRPMAWRQAEHEFLATFERLWQERESWRECEAIAAEARA